MEVGSWSLLAEGPGSLTCSTWSVVSTASERPETGSAQTIEPAPRWWPKVASEVQFMPNLRSPWLTRTPSPQADPATARAQSVIISLFSSLTQPQR